jgi:hypothetical protein
MVERGQLGRGRPALRGTLTLIRARYMNAAHANVPRFVLWSGAQFAIAQ